MSQGDQIHRYGTVRSANTGSQVPAPNGYCVLHDSELSPSVTKRPSGPRRRAARYDIIGDLPSRLGLVIRSLTAPKFLAGAAVFVAGLCFVWPLCVAAVGAPAGGSARPPRDAASL